MVDFLFFFPLMVVGCCCFPFFHSPFPVVVAFFFLVFAQCSMRSSSVGSFDVMFFRRLAQAMNKPYAS